MTPRTSILFPWPVALVLLACFAAPLRADIGAQIFDGRIALSRPVAVGPFVQNNVNLRGIVHTQDRAALDPRPVVITRLTNRQIIEKVLGAGESPRGWKLVIHWFDDSAKPAFPAYLVKKNTAPRPVPAEVFQMFQFTGGIEAGKIRIQREPAAPDDFVVLGGRGRGFAPYRVILFGAVGSTERLELQGTGGLSRTFRSSGQFYDVTLPFFTGSAPLGGFNSGEPWPGEN